MASTRGNPVSRERRAFDIWIRTGRIMEPKVEAKFNPWHDPGDGRFTFANSGRFWGSEGASSHAPQRIDLRRTPSKRPDPYRHLREPQNHSVHTVRKGDTLVKIAAQRRGLTVSDLAEVNGVHDANRLRIGQRLILPHQTYLDEGRDIKNRVTALSYYMATHGGALPPNVAHPPPIARQIADETFKRVTLNGYEYRLDGMLRTKSVNGIIPDGPPERRSRSAQRAAGGRNRRPTDDGGHFIAPRFRGPPHPINHFAQDRNFNRGAYRALEQGWARDRMAGKEVQLDVHIAYPGTSLRPESLRVKYRIDGRNFRKDYRNEPYGK